MDPIMARREPRAGWDGARGARVRLRVVCAIGALLLGGATMVGAASPSLATSAASPAPSATAHAQAPDAASSADALRADAAGANSKEQGADTRTAVSERADSSRRLGVLLMVVVLSVVAVASAASGLLLQRRPRPGPRRGL